MGINVGLVLLVKDRKILTVSRKDNHNDFGLIGGKMDDEDGGNFMVTAVRETKEETGVDISSQDMLEIYDGMCGDNRCVTYLVTDFDGEINSSEEGVVKWGSPQDLLDGSYGEYNKIVLEKYMDYMDSQKNI